MDAFKVKTIDKGYSKNEFQIVVNQSNGNEHSLLIDICYWFDEQIESFDSGFGTIYETIKELKYKIEKSTIEFIESTDKDGNEIVPVLRQSDIEKIILVIDESFVNDYAQKLIYEEND